MQTTMTTVFCFALLALAAIAFGQEEMNMKEECDKFTKGLNDALKDCYKDPSMDGGASALKDQTAVNVILRSKRQQQEWGDPALKKYGACIDNKMMEVSTVYKICKDSCVTEPCDSEETCNAQKDCVKDRVCEKCKDAMMCKKKGFGK